MKASLLMLLPSLLLAQIWTFDGSPGEGGQEHGEITYIDEAMGQAIHFTGDEYITISDVHLDDSFTIIIWVKTKISWGWRSKRGVFETDDISLIINEFKIELSSKGDTVSKKLTDAMSGLNSNEYDNKNWFPIVWTRRTVSGSFGAIRQYDSIFILNNYALSLSRTGGDVFSSGLKDVTIGKAPPDVTPDLPSTVVNLDHLCIYNNIVVTKEEIEDIMITYIVDDVSTFNSRPPKRKIINQGKGSVNLLGRTISVSRPYQLQSSLLFRKERY